jgi:hypothetical protein
MKNDADFSEKLMKGEILVVFQDNWHIILGSCPR